MSEVHSPRVDSSLPEPLYLVDSTKLRAWLTCKRKFQYGHLMHLEPAGAGSVDLEFGKAVHEGLEALEDALNAGGDRDEAIAAGLDVAFSRFPIGVFEHEKKTPESLARVLIWYAEQFYPPGQPPALKPVAHEVPFRIRLWDLAETGAIADDDLWDTDWDVDLAQSSGCHLSLLKKVALCGRLDSIVEGPSPGEFWVRERKTSSQSLSSYYFARYSPDIQVSLYAWISRLLFPQYKIQGVILEAIQTGVTFCRFERKEIRRSLEHGKETLQTILIAIREMWEAGVFGNEVDGLMPLNEAGCMAGGIPCTFRALCNTHPILRKEEMKRLYSQRIPWNPLDGTDDSKIMKLVQ